MNNFSVNRSKLKNILEDNQMAVVFSGNPIQKLGDEYFIYNEEKRQAIGEHTGKVYQIGDKVKIRVANASKLMRQIDFEIC